tara:strand:- start:169 stop:1410 length:1242 start_codon:yes stop_codon:yes gene_type:complete
MAAVTNSNTRVFYATQAVTIGGRGNVAAPIDSWKTGTTIQTGANQIVHGLQSMGVDTNFNLEQAFELGQLSLYENIEDIPDISVSMQKFLDGYSLLYHLGASFTDTVHASNNTKLNEKLTTLAGRADTRADIRMLINATTAESVQGSGAAVAELYCSGMYLSSVSYTIPTDGTCTEDVTFVGNNKKWINDPTAGADNLLLANDSGVADSFAGIFGSDEPNAPDGHVLRREDVITGSTAMNGYRTVIPNIIEGVAAGTATVAGAASTNANVLDTDNTHIVSFNCSTDLGREQINQLGTRTPYNRYVSFPTEVTSSIEMTATAGDNVNAVETARSNLSNHEICIMLADSTILHLGKKNKLSSITYGGGDAGGGNATVSYSFSNFNDLVVLHSGDPIRGNSSSTTSTTGYYGNRFD